MFHLHTPLWYLKRLYEGKQRGMKLTLKLIFPFHGDQYGIYQYDQIINKYDYTSFKVDTTNNKFDVAHLIG